MKFWGLREHLEEQIYVICTWQSQAYLVAKSEEKRSVLQIRLNNSGEVSLPGFV